ncbi:MAG: thiazole synthase [Endozoicomonadaceae bacterium]|nr:thiazole synthase [Endozoicomonadaceae bacterium]
MLTIADHIFTSRLLLGTGKFNDQTTMVNAVKASGAELVTMAMKRVDLQQKNDDILAPLQQACAIRLLPNTSGAQTAEEAVFSAKLAREALRTTLLKLEIHPDPRYLMPDPVETLKAAEELVKLGFIVFPYIHADPVICKRLEDVGCASVMPLAAPIGSNLGIRTRDFLEIIIEQSNVPVIVDAGIGSPSDAALAMEMGADAVLVNSAIAVAGDPVIMADAFRKAVEAGRQAFESGLGGRHLGAAATSPLTGFLDL